MIELIDGKGQLGKTLQELIKNEKEIYTEEAVIYHTWNVLDKTEVIQQECYKKFIDFVDKNRDKKIIFISTYSQTDNFYNYYKQLSEAYLLTNSNNGYVIRLPILLGKGICEKFKNSEVEAYGEMELMNLEDAAIEILKIIKTKPLIRNFRIKGAILPAKLAKELILFGAKKENEDTQYKQ
jgi:hypothetical protein